MIGSLQRIAASAALGLLLWSPALPAFAQHTSLPPMAAPSAESPPVDAPPLVPVQVDAPARADAPAADAEVRELKEHARALEARVAQLEQAQVATQLAAAGEDEAAALVAPDPFRIYGFADFGLNHAWLGESSFLRGLVASETTFTLGNLNLYFQFQPDPAWQVLTEIRFTAYPHGAEQSFANPLGAEYLRTDTGVVDVASPATGYKFRWGSVLIERAFARYTYSEHLNVRVGQFLTPYGIWNVDHGTPTLIALMMPHFVSTEIFPARQIGVALQGAVLSGPWEFGYDAYISNGRTATQLDFTNNKAFGLRLKAARVAPLPLTLGTSFYYGQIDDVEKRIVSFAPFRVQRDLVVEGTELGVGLDVSLDIDALRIRSEGILRVTRFTDGKRPAVALGPPGSTKPDNNEYDGYLLAAYRLPFWGLEPFVYGEYNHYVSPYGDEQAVLALGLNIHFSAFAQLKNEIARALFFDLNAHGRFSDNDMTLLFSRLAVAF
jgi:hypothetical protein